MTKEKFKTFAAVMAALVWFYLLIAGVRELVGNLVLWLLLAALFALVLLIPITAIKRRRHFRTKGYEVMVGSDHDFIYRERCETGFREFRLPGELIEMGHPVYTRLSWKDWEKVAPAWAHHRQLEIEAKIHENAFYRPDGG